MELNSSGNVATRHDYLPFGGELYAGIRNGSNAYEPPVSSTRQRFTGKERDNETGLDYFGARYMASAQGRFTSVDPIFFQKDMPTDPQRFNLYSHVRNNPLKFTDPRGEAIELLGNEEQRKKILNALREALGPRAGAYLYEDTIAGKNGKNRYFVGIKDHESGDFGKVNKVSGFIEKVILDQRVAQVSLAARGESVSAYGVSATIGQGENQVGPAWTLPHPTGEVKTWIMDPGDTINGIYALYPADLFQDNVDAKVAFSSDALIHELGHVYATWFSLLMPDRGGNFSSASGDFAVQLENMSRRLRDPNAALRTRHNATFLEPHMSPQQALPK